MATRSNSTGTKKTNVTKSRIKESDTSPSPAKTKKTMVVKKSSEIPRTPTHIIGIGASAGGLEAIEEFFRNIPDVTGMAFVVIQHLSPDFKSLMGELMARFTKMDIHRVEDNMKVEPNAVYLIPPKKEMVIKKGQLRVKDREPKHNLNLPIDKFLHSLAEDMKEKAVAIILSGTGSDGSRGIKSIHDAGGLVIVQNEESAKFDGMPKSAIATSFADLVVPPFEMPDILVMYSQGLLDKSLIKDKRSIIFSENSVYKEIFKLLLERYGIDFAMYKPTTIGRRIERRMSIRQYINLEKYIDRLNRDEQELEALYKDLLIGVTQFFRDPEAFEIIENRVIPSIFSEIKDDEEVRIWVPGCASGEEAYSLAILLKEAMLKFSRRNNLKIFATDAHKFSLEKAALGTFSDESVMNVPDKYLSKYFIKGDDNYKVKPVIRKMVVFAEHNVIKDPPFTKIDLVSCRNLLIYLQPNAQRKALSYFHFSLKTGGTLFLGPSETLGNLENEFLPIDKHWKIYKKRRDVRIADDTHFSHVPFMNKKRIPIFTNKQTSPQTEIRISRAYELLLQQYVPPSLLIDENRRLIHSFGPAREFLTPPSGRFDLDILSMVEGDLRIAISTALQRAEKENKAIAYKGIKFMSGDKAINLQVIVKPLIDKASDVDHYLVILEEIKKEPGFDKKTTKHDKNFRPDKEAKAHIKELEEELQFTKEHLQATVEELETSNEELQATNEELLASNEELQSTNEELHSVNEELYTVNGEYERKIEELTQLNNDIDNLMNSTMIGTVFLDKNLKIRKYTPAIKNQFSIMSQDIDRPLFHIANKIKDNSELFNDINRVLSTDEASEREIETEAGRWYLERILPYKDEKNKTQGIVLTYIDINEAKKASDKLRDHQEQLKMALKAIDAGIWTWTISDNRVMWDERTDEIFGFDKGEFTNDIDGWKNRVHPDDVENAIEALRDAAEGGPQYDVIYRVKGKGNEDWRYIHSISKTIYNERGQAFGMTGLCHDVTEMHENEIRLNTTLDELSAKNRLVEGIFNVTPAVIYVYNIKEKKNIFTSRSIPEFLGYTREDVGYLSGALLKSFMHPDDVKLYKSKINQQYKSASAGQIINYKYRVQKKDGNWRWLDCREVVHSREEDGSPKRILGLAYDITNEMALKSGLSIVVSFPVK